MCQLLIKYLPELKQHLRKKSLNFDDIIIEEDIDETNNLKDKKWFKDFKYIIYN